VKRVIIISKMAKIDNTSKGAFSTLTAALSDSSKNIELLFYGLYTRKAIDGLHDGTVSLCLRQRRFKSRYRKS